MASGPWGTPNDTITASKVTGSIYVQGLRGPGRATGRLGEAMQRMMPRLVEGTMVMMTITGLEGQAQGVTLEVPFNPKEISIDRVVGWRQQPTGGAASLEYAGGGSTTMAFELMFDGSETNTTVQPHVAKLHQLSDADATLKRPPKVRVAYGAGRVSGLMPPFDGVIEAVSVKYLMFAPNGAVLRATAALRFREADKVKVAPPP